MKKKELEQLVSFLISILDTVPFDLWYKDLNGKYRVVNKNFEEYAGKSKEEIIGKDDYEIFPKGEADIYTESDRKTLNGCSLSSYNSEYKPGRYKEEVKQPAFDCDGNLIGTTGFSRDITENKRIYDALKESERSKAALLSNLPGMAYRCKNDENWTMTFLSDGCYELTGYTAKELIGNSKLNYYDLIPAEYREKLFRKWRNEAEQNCIKTADEYPVMTRSGELKWVWEQDYAIIDENGIQVANEGFITDITDKKLFEEALMRSEERFRMIFEKSQIGIGVFESLSGKAQQVNNRFCEILGRSMDEILKLDWTQYSYPDDIEENLHKMHLMNRNLIDSFSIDKRFIKPDGTIVWTNLIVTPFMAEDAAKPNHFCLLHDITAQKQAEEKSIYLNYHDQLTGLYNRRYYDEVIQTLDHEKNLPITLAMADVNGLKLTNDAFGHIAGDQILVKIGNILKRECRENDVVARIGGDEFMLLLPNTGYDEGERLILQIQGAIMEESWENIICSLSFGLGTKNEPTEEIKKIYMIAEDQMYRNKLSESRSMRYETIMMITESLYRKNRREQLHCERVSELCVEIGRAMGFNPTDVAELKTAGLLHDIGKIGINESLLNKSGALSADEWEEVKNHAEIGYHILSSVNEFATIAEYVLCHHERLDGKGYPRKLRGSEIPLQSKIISLADSYDAMTSIRSYKDVLTKPEAIREIRAHAGTQFDPEIARVFVEKVLKEND